MSADGDRLKALRFEGPETIPVSVGILPAAWMEKREALDELVHRYPEVCGGQAQDDRDYEAVGGTYVSGDHVDAWGCVWQNVYTGRESIVTGHPVPKREEGALGTLDAQPGGRDGRCHHGPDRPT